MTGEPVLFAGLRLALSFFTVAPVPVRRVDRRVAGVAMALAPAVGAVLGVVLGGVGLLLRLAGAAPLVAAAAAVTCGVLLTRGLHLDGIADTVDGLGSYRDRSTSLEIMKRSDIGPFGVAAIGLTLLSQTASLTTVLARGPSAALAGAAAAVAAGRVAVGLACRRGVPAARETGLGALVAGTVAIPTAVVAALGAALLALPAVPGRPWQGPVAVLLGLACSWALTRHAVRRLGGVTGDVLGANVEAATTAALLVLAVGPVG